MRRLAIFAVLLVACSGTPSAKGSVPLSRIHDAVKKTQERSTAALSLAVEYEDGSNSDFEATSTYSGVVSLTEDLARLTYDDGVSPYSVRLTNGAYYFAYPDAPNGKEWVKFTLDEYSQYFTPEDGIGDGTTFLESLNLLSAAEGSPKNLGQEKVRNTETTKYRVAVDLRKFFNQRKYFSSEAKNQMLAAYGDSLTVMVWLDENDRVRRIVYRADYAGDRSDPEFGLGGVVTTVFELWDFDVPLDVKPPPEDEIANGDEYSRSFQEPGEPELSV